MTIRSVAVAIILVVLTLDAEACRKKVVLNGADKNWHNKVCSENTDYVIKNCIDLNGSTLTIPDNCCLVFDGGVFQNGMLEGKHTNVSAGKTLIFKDVTLTGSWNNGRVYSEWLDFIEGEKVDNACNFKNLMLLCKSDVMTHLYMQEGTYYCSVVTGSSNIIVPSNIYWHNLATICQLPTDSPKYGFVLIRKSNNVTIDGGVFVGDVKSHTGKDGEWGHGIKVAGASNVVLKNLVSREFWGDGIDLIEGEYVSSIASGVGICDHITINNVKCLYNRRQGLSIEAAQNIIVNNSEFAYTGKFNISEAGCGVDIEPWCKNEKKIENIIFYKCYIHDNNPKRDFCVEANLQYYDKSKDPGYAPINKIVVKKCRIGKLYVLWANTVVFNCCEIEKISTFNFGYNVKMEKCRIGNLASIKKKKGLMVIKCTKWKSHLLYRFIK